LNIKRRLFISNLLMIVIPLSVSLAVFFGGLHLYVMIAGLRDGQEGHRYRGEITFMEAADRAQALAEKWRAASSAAIEEGAALEEGVMKDGVKKFNEEHSDGKISLTLYKNGVPITPAPALPDGEPLVEQALRKGEEESVTLFTRLALHAQRIGEEYRLVLRAAYRFARSPQNYREVMTNGLIVSLACSVFIILFTNRFLTQFVFGKIVHALETLTHGVHQVRDGNLAFRIDYKGNDEFSEVCGDFNEMAVRLLDSVSARQKDERSRKELIAGISHDLRTPLTSIKAYVEGIEKGVAATPEAYKRYIETIRNKTEDLEHIIDTLFLFSKLDTGEFPYRVERVDLNAMAAEAVENLAGEYAGMGLDISLSLSSERAWVKIDPEQLRYVMINIFENSVKYKNKERGKMTVTVSPREGAIALDLSDDGPGVPEETLPKLFGVFYRGDPSRNNPSDGSGLGLAIAATIVRHFGGAIKAVNAPGGGLSIVMTFPQVENGRMK
jgi:signal transduction histidine kinase